jgi:hypothetical protein
LVTDPELALSLTSKHRQIFADGSLAEEREFIGIRALVRLGRRQDARERMDQFLRAFPRSAYRARVEQLREGEEEK